MPIPTYRMRIADISVPFTVAPDAAFDYLADPAHRPEWQSSLRRVDNLVAAGGAPGDTGTAWTDVTAVPGVAPRMEVTDCVRGQRWCEIGRWRFVDARLDLTFSGQPDGGTQVGAVAHLTVPIVLFPGLAILRLITPLALRADLQSAARVLARS